MPRPVAHPRIATAVLVAAMMAITVAAHAAEAQSWTIARRNPEGIRTLVQAQRDRLATLPHLAGEPAVILQRSDTWDVYDTWYRIIRNEVILVTDPRLDEASRRQFQYGEETKLELKGAWILRGEEVLRLKDSAWTIVKGDGSMPDKAIIAFPDVKAGDVLGWSVELKVPETYLGDRVAVASNLPLVLFRARFKTNGNLAYKVIGENMPEDKWSTKINDVARDFPIDYVVSVLDVAPQATGPYAPRAYEAEPGLFVAYRGFWSDNPRRWVRNATWGEEIADAAGYIEYLEEQCAGCGPRPSASPRTRSRLSAAPWPSTASSGTRWWSRTTARSARATARSRLRWRRAKPPRIPWRI